MNIRRLSQGSFWGVAGPLALALVAAAVFLVPIADCSECIPGIFVITEGGSRAGPPVCRGCGGRGRISAFNSWRDEGSVRKGY